jgi:hypothetical protein
VIPALRDGGTPWEAQISRKFSHGRARSLRLKKGAITTALGPVDLRMAVPAVLIVYAGAAWIGTVTRCSQDPTVGFRDRDRVGVSRHRRGRPKTVDQRTIIAEPLRPPQAEDLNAGPLLHALIPWHGDLFQNRCDSRIQPILLKHNGDVAFCWHHGSVNT